MFYHLIVLASAEVAFLVFLVAILWQNSTAVLRNIILYQLILIQFEFCFFSYQKVNSMTPDSKTAQALVRTLAKKPGFKDNNMMVNLNEFSTCKVLHFYQKFSSSSWPILRY